LRRAFFKKAESKAAIVLRNEFPAAHGNTFLQKAANQNLSIMPGKKHGNVKDSDKYEALRDKGMSKERAAKISNSPGASKRGGEHSHGGHSKK
jgi:hypothetical protein